MTPVRSAATSHRPRRAALLEGLEANLREAAAELATGRSAGTTASDLDAFLAKVELIAHGTTAATNAYLERRGR